jgi:hypothetical protein
MVTQQIKVGFGYISIELWASLSLSSSPFLSLFLLRLPQPLFPLSVGV